MTNETETNDKTETVMTDSKVELGSNARSFTLETKNSDVSIDGKTYEGVVIWFGASKKQGANRSTKSFGFIEWFSNGEQQRDLFVHFSAIVSEEGAYRSLKKGQKVSFGLGTNHYGEVKAISVRVIG